MRIVEPDHIVLQVPDVEAVVAWYAEELGVEVLRLEEWRKGEAVFVSLRVSPTFLIDVLQGERTGENLNHVAFVTEDVDLDQLAASGRHEVVAGPADLFGAQGMGRGLYIKDPADNVVELRTYA